MTVVDHSLSFANGPAIDIDRIFERQAATARFGSNAGSRIIHTPGLERVSVQRVVPVRAEQQTLLRQEQQTVRVRVVDCELWGCGGRVPIDPIALHCRSAYLK